MSTDMKLAVVTPYFKESDDLMLQCHRSVRTQTYPCTHLLVADGFAKPAIAAPHTLHVSLPLAHGDFGNTPRLIGGLLAESYGFDAVMYLDADNWFAPDHAAKMVAAYESSGSPIIAAKRTFRHLSGDFLSVSEPQEDQFQHVDTNCWFIARPAFAILGGWRLPNPLSAIGDRLFFLKARASNFTIHETPQRSVNYRSKFPAHYHGAKAAVPAGVYESNHVQAAFAYAQTPAGRQAVEAYLKSS